MAPTDFTTRARAVRQFVSDYTDARIEKPYELDADQLPPMYDDYRTEAEIAVVHSAADRGVIPSELNTREDDDAELQLFDHTQYPEEIECIECGGTAIYRGANWATWDCDECLTTYPKEEAERQMEVADER